MGNLGTIGLYTLAFYVGGAVSLFQMCSISIGRAGQDIPFLARLWAALLWPFAAYVWTEENFPRGDDDGSAS